MPFCGDSSPGGNYPVECRVYLAAPTQAMGKAVIATRIPVLPITLWMCETGILVEGKTRRQWRKRFDICGSTPKLLPRWAGEGEMGLALISLMRPG